MPTIYNQTYKVPVWVVLNVPEPSLLENLKQYLVENGAVEQGWPSDSFITTVKSLASKGWDHVVKKPPYTMDSTFATIALAEHTRRFFGPNKTLNLNADRPWYQTIDRNIRSDDDYRNLFNDIIYIQDPITLSHLFDIGNKCYNNNIKTKVFFTVGNVHRNLLQPITNNVIVVSDGGDVTLSDDTLAKLDSTLDSLLKQ